MADIYALPAVAEKRVRYFDGQFLQAQDFSDEQSYQLDREHRVSRLLHGPGVADGLAVTSAAPNQVTVAPGTAIDVDGWQLALAQATNVDLPAADFNNQHGVQLYISYLVSAEDPQTVGGSSDFTRWLERPQLTALAQGGQWTGTSQPVLLATLALDGAGRVTIDTTVRSYSGVLLPGPGADPAVLQATSAGTVSIGGPLTVNAPPSGTPFTALEIDAQSFVAAANLTTSYFLNMRDVGAGPGGAYRFCVRGDGNVGIGTGTPGARLEVVGGGGGSIDLLVNGRLKSDSNDGGLWVSGDRFVGGVGANVGFYTGGHWMLQVMPSGNVGIGTETGAPNARLEVAGSGGTTIDLIVNGRLQSNSNDGGLWVSSDRFIGGVGANVGFWTGGHWMLQVMPSGNVGIGTGTGAPAARLEVVGAGGTNVDLLVNGRLKSNSNDGGLWVSADRFIGGFGSTVGLWNNNAWRLTVAANGNVGVGLGATAPASPLHVLAPASSSPFTALQIDVQSFGTVANQAVSYFVNMRDVGGGPGGAYRFCVRGDGNVGLGTGTPKARLEVAGAGGTNIDLIVNGRMQSNNPDGGLWVTDKTFVGGTGGNIGFWSNGWHVLVMPDGTVGVHTTNTLGQTFAVNGSTWLNGATYVNNLIAQIDQVGHWRNFGTKTAGLDPTSWVYANDVGGPSDERLKTDLRPVSNALDLISRLQAVRYRWGDDGFSYLTRDIEETMCAGPGASAAEHEAAKQEGLDEARTVLDGERVGLVAQDVEAVLPELVHEVNGYKHIRYQNLTALLAEAIKELSAQVTELRATAGATS
jgi:hypothetical protein